MRRSVVLPFVLAALLAGCGGDDEETAPTGGAEPEAAAPAEPAALAIGATGREQSPSFEVAADTPAGLTEITFTNDADGTTDSQLVRVDGEYSEEEVIEQFGKAVSGEPVEDWFLGAGGVGEVKKGESGSVTQVLEPGLYYILGGQKPADELASFEVTGEAAGELPEAPGGTLTATEYSFGGTLTAGEPVLLENAGGNWHHFVGFKLNEGATADDLGKFFKTNGKGKPPFDPAGGLSSSVFDPGVAQVVDLELTPGAYGFVCFIADREGGPPHFQRGMISEIEVQ